MRQGFEPLADCRTEGKSIKLTAMPSSFGLLSRLDGLTALQHLAGVGADAVLVAKVRSIAIIQNLRSQQYNHFRPLVVLSGSPEQRTDNRQISQNRNLVRCNPFFVADNPRNNQSLTVPEAN